MFDIQNYPSFIASVIVFQLIPGAGTLAILNATARHGIAAGFGAVFGTLLGDFLFMAAAIVGLATFLTANPLVFNALQWFGVAYLCWLGFQLLRAPVSAGESAQEKPKSGWLYFRQACIVSLTNPKVILFFVAFFPLFMRVDSSGVTLIAMMTHVTVISLIYQAGIVLVGHSVARKLRRLPSARIIATRLAGLALIAFGVKLALNNR